MGEGSRGDGSGGSGGDSIRNRAHEHWGVVPTTRPPGPVGQHRHWASPGRTGDMGADGVRREVQGLRSHREI
eukprot:11114445-Heterocapsa_arctica.AAC.1